ncbi:hypothetical protein AB0N81_19550 [Streptomyces sp. NPDC093510]|uniref:hypothetical protein n=1 Tax=Streptomyces sp. NPDC093510 TaxID=3155199 RepID=UPI003430FCB2
MSDRTHEEEVSPGAEPDAPLAAGPEPPVQAGHTSLRTGHASLRTGHAARAKSAALRTAAIHHYVEQHGAEQNTSWKTAHAARVSAQALAVLSESAPDPAADSRCARNAAAAAAQAAQMARLHDGDSEPAATACRAALKASQAAATAAGRDALGADETLNVAADEAEADAVAAAEHAGWMQQGRRLPETPTGLRSPELMSMMHF